eukprot:TRINITY_DN15091_c0_g2_i1.p1 TRINITY_DN15091_c0_g2~~TRINITY_DN15091_c0_g2_i1.p1  ORF type:complete len:518 (-),score=237.38 TRINITY_DN15091_c0_g2_i1:128-1681(-)
MKKKAGTGDPKVRELERKVRELTKIIEDYKANELSGDARVKELGEMNSKKVKALLKSIDQLKKENTKLQLLQKDNVKARVIDQYKKDIETQDFIIKVLRKLVGDDDKCDLAIVKELNKGPERIRSATREELLIENKRLKSQLQGTMERSEKLKTAASRRHTVDKDIGDIAELEKELIEVRAELEDLRLKSVKEVEGKNGKICELMSELTDVKSELAGKNEMVARLNAVMESTNERLKEKIDLEAKLFAMTNQYNELKKAMDRKLKEFPEAGDARNDGGVDQEEIRIKNQSFAEILKQTKDNLEEEKNELKEILNAYKNENEKLKGEAEELQRENAEQAGRIAALESKLSLNEGDHEEQKKLSGESHENLVKQVTVLQSEKAVLNEKYIRLLVYVEDLESQLQSKIIELEVYQAKLSEHARGDEKLGKTGMEMMAEANEMELLRKKVKELATREVDLMEQLENERDKNRTENEKIKMVHLVNTQKRTASLSRAEEEVAKYKLLYKQTLEKLAKYERTA